ncbi:MAG: hypothetical protein GKS01_03200 [Alphaproteobacteria bacterium]|nr:hypothetical protein [Alphaproteobacteria bacterium]
MKKIAGWNLALLFSGLLIIELTFGSWLSGGGLGAVHVPRDLVLQHDAKGIRSGGGVVRYSRDRWGLRGSHKNPSEINILTIGGSTTDEFYSDDAETWSARLQQKFVQAGFPAIIGNAGVNGHSSVGHILSLESWLSRIPNLKPKFILFYLGINDVALPARAEQDAIVAIGSWARIRRYIINNSIFIRLTRLIRGSFRAKQLRIAYENAPPKLVWQGNSPEIDGALYRKVVSTYGDRVRRLFELTTRMDALPVFISQRRGDAFFRNGVLFASSSDAAKNHQIQKLYNQEMLRTCQAVKAICIDLANQINLSEADFFDRIHTTPDGSDKIAAFLFEKLQRIVRKQLLHGQANTDSGTAKR